MRWRGADGIHPVGVLGACVALAVSPPLGALAAFVLVRSVRHVARRASRRWHELAQAGQWATLACAAALTSARRPVAGTSLRTRGRRIYHLHPVDGFCSQGASAAVILSASLLAAPTSTTQIVASSVVGVGAGRRRWHHVRWALVRHMGLAWIVTMPASAAFVALAFAGLRRAS